MNQKLYVICAFLFLAACGINTPEKDSGPAQLPNGPTQQDLTERTLCKGVTPVGTTLVGTVWSETYRRADGILIERELRFQPTSMEVKSVATYQTVSKNLLVTSPIRLSVNQFQIVNPAASEATFEIDGNSIVVTEALPGGTMLYNFIGPCVKLQHSSRTVVLVPKK